MLVFTNLPKSGRPLSNFYLNTCSNVIRTISEISQTEHTIETRSKRYQQQYACILHWPQLPPKLRTVPSAGLEVVKESLCIYILYIYIYIHLKVLYETPTLLALPQLSFFQAKTMSSVTHLQSSGLLWVVTS